jgi:hypothetical protein
MTIFETILLVIAVFWLLDMFTSLYGPTVINKKKAYISELEWSLSELEGIYDTVRKYPFELREFSNCFVINSEGVKLIMTASKLNDIERDYLDGKCLVANGSKLVDSLTELIYFLTSDKNAKEFDLNISFDDLKSKSRYFDEICERVEESLLNFKTKFQTLN